MNINLTMLVTNNLDDIVVDDDVVIPATLISSSEIRRLYNVHFKGDITRLYNGDYSIEGVLTGTMILADAVTLEDVSYDFNIEISEEFDEFGKKNDNNLKIVQNTLDITEFLWQNILVEIPLKVVSEKNQNLKLEGNGWRLITEEDLEHSNNSPFSELKEKLNSRKE